MQQNAIGLLHQYVTTIGNASIPPYQAWLKVMNPETGGAAGAGTEIAAATPTFAFGIFSIYGKTV